MGARFKLDENLPHAAAALLRDAGHDVHPVHDEGLNGKPDGQIPAACNSEGRILVTLDLDFADIRRHPPSIHAGVWVLHPATQSIDNTLKLLRGALGLLEKEATRARLWIVEPGRVRIRE